jgi:hypothetical protein
MRVGEMKLKYRLARWIWSLLPYESKRLLAWEWLEAADEMRVIRRELADGDPAWFAIVPFKPLRVTISDEPDQPIDMTRMDVMHLSSIKRSITVEVG